MMTHRMGMGVLLLGTLLLTVGCAYTPDVKRHPDMNEGQAALAVCELLRENAEVMQGSNGYPGIRPGATVAGTLAGRAMVQQPQTAAALLREFGPALQLVALGRATASASPVLGGQGAACLRVVGPDGPMNAYGLSMDKYKRLLDCLYAIRYWRSAPGQAEKATAFAAFQEQARAWRALPVKPNLPQEIRRFRNLAENALREKESGKAAGYYEQGLEVAPLWPEGWHESALIYAEAHCYAQAALDMKRYLELCSDASAADAARRQTEIWEEKGKESAFPLPAQILGPARETPGQSPEATPEPTAPPVETAPL